MLGQKTVCRFLGPPCWTCAVLACAASTEPAPLVVEVAEPVPTSRTPLPPDEGEEAAVLAERDIDAEQAERETLVRAAETVTNLRPRIEQCFLAHVSGVKKRRIVLHFVVRTTGRAAHVRIVPNLGDDALRRCVRDVFRSVRFDRPTRDGMRVSVPIKLGVP